MKKMICLLLGCLAFWGAAAQPLPAFDQVEEYVQKHKSSVSKTDFLVLDYIGYGFHGLLDAEDAYAGNTAFWLNREIYFNLFGLVYRPGEHHTLTLGVDLDWDNYRVDSGHLWIPADRSVRVATLDEAKLKSVSKSILRVLSFDIPLDYTLSAGALKLTLGASAQLSLPGRTRLIGVNLEDSEVRNVKSGPFRATDIKTRPFTWNAHVQLTVANFGLYAKYAPMPVLEQAYGPQFATWTVGLILR